VDVQSAIAVLQDPNPRLFTPEGQARQISALESLAAAAAEDLAPWREALLLAYKRASMHPEVDLLSAALMRLARAGDAELLERMLALPLGASHAATALCTQATRHDLRLLRALPASEHKEVLEALIRRDSGLLAELVADEVTLAVLWSVLLFRPPPLPHVGDWLVAPLGEPHLVDAAALVARLAWEAGQDLTPAADALERALVLASARERGWAASALVGLLSQQGRHEAAHALARHDDAEVRAGALHRLANLLHTAPDPAGLDTLVQALADPSAKVRRLVRGCLTETPGPLTDTALAWLVARVDADDAVGEVLSAHLDRAPDLARRLVALTPQDHSARRLVAEDASPCSACGRFPRSGDPEDHASLAFEPALPKGEVSGLITRCAVCGDPFAYTMSVFEDVNFRHVQRSLERLGPVEAMPHVPADWLVERLKTARQRLRWPEPLIAGRAGWWCAAHALNSGDVHALADWLVGAREAAVVSALATVRTSSQSIDLSPLRAVASGIDTSDSRWLVAATDPDWAGLATSDDPWVVIAAVEAIRASTVDLEVLASLLEHPDGRVRKAVIGASRWLMEDVRVAAIDRAVAVGRPIDALGLAKTLPPTDEVALALSPVLKGDEADRACTWWRKNMAAMSPASRQLGVSVLGASMRPELAHEAQWMLQTAAGHGASLQSALDGMADMLPSDPWSFGSLILTLLRGGGDIRSAVPRLVAQLDRRATDAVAKALVIWSEAHDVQVVSQLLRHEEPSVVRTVLYAMREATDVERWASELDELAEDPAELTRDAVAQLRRGRQPT
jgi:hypothetical protein